MRRNSVWSQFLICCNHIRMQYSSPYLRHSSVREKSHFPNCELVLGFHVLLGFPSLHCCSGFIIEEHLSPMGNILFCVSHKACPWLNSFQWPQPKSEPLRKYWMWYSRSGPALAVLLFMLCFTFVVVLIKGLIRAVLNWFPCLAGFLLFSCSISNIWTCKSR